MPVYNAAPYLEASISAVLAQTFADFELLLINDGSTDGSSEILAQFAVQDSRIKVFQNEKNLGLIKTLNRGIEAAQGDFIARTDADDIVMDYWLEKVLAKMQGNPEIMACSGYMQCFSDGSEVKHSFTPTCIVGVREMHEQLFDRLPFECPMNHPCTVIRADVFRSRGLRYDENYSHCEDYKLWFDISKFGKFANVPEVLVNYRLHENQISSKYRTAQLEGSNRVRIEMLNLILHTAGIDYQVSNPLTAQDIYLIWDYAEKYVAGSRVRWLMEIVKAVIDTANSLATGKQ